MNESHIFATWVQVNNSLVTLDYILYDLPDRTLGANTVHKDEHNVIIPITSDVQVLRLRLLRRVTVTSGFATYAGK